MNRLFFLLVMACAVVTGNGQMLFSLHGKVIDTKTKEPVPFATVFFASTALGTTSKEDGSYRIDNIPSGKFELIARSVGYKKFSASILFSDSSLHWNISLMEDITTLKEVVVRPNRSDFNKYYSTFEKYFLGLTPNASHCSIKNKDAIDIQYSSEENALNVSASEPLQIENKALGYTIYYLLEDFEINYKKEFFKTFGIPRFEELTPKNESQKSHWARKRDEAYYGSLTHFMRSLLTHDLMRNRFMISTFSKDGHEKRINEDSLFVKDHRNQFRIGKKLKVVFEGQSEDRNFSKIYRGYQTSTIVSGESPITIYDNGHFDDLRNVLLDGYLGYRECLSNLVPLGYQPASILK